MAASGCGFEQQLINAVILRPFLFDKKHPDHSKRQKVSRAWAEISQEIGRSAEACKTRWRSLRDRFYTIYKMKSGVSENALEETPPTWAFFSSLRFLLDVKELPQRTNYNSLDDDGVEETGSDSRNSGIRLKEEPPDELPEQNMIDMQNLAYTQMNDAPHSPLSSTSEHSPPSSPVQCSKKARKRRQPGPNDRLLQTIDKIGADMAAQHQQDSAVFAHIYNNGDSMNCKKYYPFLAYLGCLLDEFTEDEKDDLQFDILKLVHLKKKSKFVNGNSK